MGAARLQGKGRGTTMKRFIILILLVTFPLSALSFGQAFLTDAQVTAAIDRASTGKRHQIGLTLNDLQTNLLSGMLCTSCKTTGYTIFVYTPESWIELQAVHARREMLPFGLKDVTPEMRLPYIHALASPSRPEYLNANGMAMASSVHRIVLSSTDRSDVVQPLSESHSAVEINSALRSFTQASAGAVFSVEDVERLRSRDPKGEFFIVIVGDNQNKYFKVKTKFFNQLFGQTSDPRYAKLKVAPSEAGAGRAEAQVAEPPTPKAMDTPSVPASIRLPTVAEYGHASHEEPTHASVPPQTALSVERAKPDLAAVTRMPIAVSTKPNPVVATGKPSAPPNKMIVRAGPYDAYQHDNALIAELWGLREPKANGLSQVVGSTSLAKGAVTAGGGSMEDEGSIGAWSDEKPRIRHDGVKIDRMTPNGPADQAGLQTGDVVLALDGVYVFTVEELTDNVHRCKPATKVPLRYRRRSTIYDTFVVMGTETTPRGQTSVKAAE